jgi:hypothetical protein
MYIRVFWYFVTRRYVNSYRSFWREKCLHVQGHLVTEEVPGLQESEDEDFTLLRNIGNYTPVDTV